MNPMGRDVSGPEYLEHALTDLLEEIFSEIGIAYERHTIAPSRDNIIARLEAYLAEAHTEPRPHFRKGWTP